ncbi:MAG: GNAT family N-acetyltransferase [Steroidobacteraceae bacterium]
MIAVRRPAKVTELDETRALMRAFVAWHRERHREDLRLIDAYFDTAHFEEELASLPGQYSPPAGQLLLAYHGDEPAGCVALRRIDAQACEMKRMFLYPRYRGQGIGRALGESIIRDARAAGYASMRLDTSVRQAEAQALYAKLGFRRIDPYYELPAALRDWLVFFELRL